MGANGIMMDLLNWCIHFWFDNEWVQGHPTCKHRCSLQIDMREPCEVIPSLVVVVGNNLLSFQTRRRCIVEEFIACPGGDCEVVSKLRMLTHPT